MGLFGKKKKEEDKELPALPRFPEMEEVKRAIKPASETSEFSLPPLPPLPPLSQMSLIKSITAEKEISERFPQTSSYPSMPQMPVEEIPEASPLRKSRSIEEMGLMKKSKEPIYVKIEHFKVALATFEEIKKRLEDSFELLDQIKSTRAEEKEKIDNWEREIESIKQKIAELDSRLFSKVED